MALGWRQRLVLISGDRDGPDHPCRLEFDPVSGLDRVEHFRIDHPEDHGHGVHVQILDRAVFEGEAAGRLVDLHGLSLDHVAIGQWRRRHQQRGRHGQQCTPFAAALVPGGRRASNGSGVAIRSRRRRGPDQLRFGARSMPLPESPTRACAGIGNVTSRGGERCAPSKAGAISVAWHSTVRHPTVCPAPSPSEQGTWCTGQAPWLSVIGTTASPEARNGLSLPPCTWASASDGACP